MVQLNAGDPEDGPDTLVGKCVNEQLPASPFRHKLNILRGRDPASHQLISAR
jgi:hypothetical protein